MEVELDPLIQDRRGRQSSKLRCSVSLCLASSILAGLLLLFARLRARGADSSQGQINPLALYSVFLPAESESNVIIKPATGLDVNSSSLNKEQAMHLQHAIGWPPAELLHKGENCWKPCKNLSGDCAWCGAGNACCRYLAESDPPECQGVSFSNFDYHTCVAPQAHHAVKHRGQDCYFACSGSGYCDWCGKGNACCRPADNSAPECAGAPRSIRTNRYECVPTMGPCPPGQISDGYGCITPETAPTLTFYMYRALGPGGLQANRSTTMANLAGTLWYLHNEVVTYCPRKNGIDRIQRYLVEMKASSKLYSTGQNFDSYVNFEGGKCQETDCAAKHWHKYGYNVGCKLIDPSTETASYPDAIWYSLPGPCPSQDDTSRTADCKANEPGGQCQSLDGTDSCTFSLQDAGYILLDELAGIGDDNLFCMSGNYEYDITSDTGIGNSFWNSRLSTSACYRRITRVQDLFEQAFPNLPRSLDQHPCDALTD